MTGKLYDCQTGIEGDNILKKNTREGNQSTIETNPGPSGPDRERSSFRRLTSRKKRKKTIKGGSSPAPANGAALDEEWSASQFKVPAAEGKTRFHDFEFPDPLLHAISDLGFEYCTPIQSEILPAHYRERMQAAGPRPVRERRPPF